MIFDESDPRYDAGTTSNTVDSFFQRFEGVVPIGSHIEQSGYSSVHYYFFTNEGAFVQARKGIADIKIEVWGAEEPATLVAKLIREKTQKNKQLPTQPKLEASAT